MKYIEIYEQFKRVSKLTDEDIVDYRPCTEFYAGVNMPNSIIVELKNNNPKHIIYTAYDINETVTELGKVMGNNTLFEQGFHYALEEVKYYGHPNKQMGEGI